MSDIIEEAKEDYRIEQILNFVKKYANWLIGGVLSLFIGTAGYLYWQHHQEQKMLKNAEEFEAALVLLSQKKESEAAKALKELEASGTEGFALVSAFKGTRQEGISPEEKAQRYYEIAQTKNFEQKYRDLALIQWAYQVLDDRDGPTLLKEIEPLLNVNNPWAPFAREISALVHIRLGEFEKASSFLKPLIEDERAPLALRQRAVAYIQQMTTPR